MKNSNKSDVNQKKWNLSKKQVIYRSIMAGISVVCIIGILVLKFM